MAGPEKLRQEVQLQAKLSHVNIVELKQVLLTRHHLGIVMTYEDGGDLDHYCSTHQVDETTARYFFHQVVSAVAYCHANRIAHRDLKLANFLMTSEQPPRVLLADFGCARQWRRSKKAEGKEVKAHLQRFQTYAGTPAYMAPQVLQSAFYPTNTYSAPGADVWAVGILLTHMFFGSHTPFWMVPNAMRGEVQTMQARIRAMKEKPWYETDSVLKQRFGALSEELRDLLARIFVAEEEERITIQGIQQHPWFTAPLPDQLQAALDAMEEEQDMRDSMHRAAVSTAVGRHDVADNSTGDFATIDAIMSLAMRHRTMPQKGQHLFVLDMAHMSREDVHSADTAPSTPALSPHASRHGAAAAPSIFPEPAAAAIAAAVAAAGGSGVSLPIAARGGAADAGAPSGGDATAAVQVDPSARGSSGGGERAVRWDASVPSSESGLGDKSANGARTVRWDSSVHGIGSMQGNGSVHGNGSVRSNRSVQSDRSLHGTDSSAHGGTPRVLTMRRHASGLMLASYEASGAADGEAANGGAGHGGEPQSAFLGSRPAGGTGASGVETSTLL